MNTRYYIIEHAACRRPTALSRTRAVCSVNVRRGLRPGNPASAHALSFPARRSLLPIGRLFYMINIQTVFFFFFFPATLGLVRRFHYQLHSYSGTVFQKAFFFFFCLCLRIIIKRTPCVTARKRIARYKLFLSEEVLARRGRSVHRSRCNTRALQVEQSWIVRPTQG